MISPTVDKTLTARRLPLKWWQWLAGAAGLAFLLLGVFLPQKELTNWLAGPLVMPQRVAEGVGFLPPFFALDGILLLVLMVAPVFGLKFPLIQTGSLQFGLRNQAQAEERRYNPWPQLALLGIIAIGVVLRFMGAGSDLWLDETGSLPTVRLPANQLIATYQSPNQHILYALLANLSAALFGESALILRLPALLFGVGGIWALYRLGRILTGVAEALLASLLLAVSYHHIFFSQNARGYTEMVCLSLLASVVFLRAVERNRGWLWLLYGLLTILNVYTHMYGAFVTAGHLTAYAGFLWWQRKEWSRTWPVTTRLLVAVGIAGLVCLQLYVLVLPQVFNYFTVTERKGIGFGYSNSTSFLSEVLKGLQIGFIGLAGLAIVGVFGLVGLWSYLRQSVFSMVALFAWMAYPVLSVVILKMGVYPRFFLFALPVGLLLVARGVHLSVDWVGLRLRGESKEIIMTRRYGWIAVALVGAILSSTGLIPLYTTPKQNFTGALAYAESVKQPGDKVVAVNMAGPVYKNFFDPGLTSAEDSSDLEALRTKNGNLWLLYIFPADMQARFPELYQLIQSQSQPVKVFKGLIGDGEVYLNLMKPEK